MRLALCVLLGLVLSTAVPSAAAPPFYPEFGRFTDGPGAWSPSGRTVAVFRASLGRDGRERLNTWLLDLGSGVERDLGEGTLTQWSPDSRRLAGHRGRAGVVLDLTAGTEKVLAADVLTIAWSPGGALAFDRLRPSLLREIVASSPDGPEARPLGRGYAPAWAPDGRRLAFVELLPRPPTSSFGRAVISVIGADGHGHRQLSNGEQADEPTWTRGGRILWVEEEVAPGADPDDVTPIVTLIDPDGRRKLRLGVGQFPIPSSSGRRVAFWNGGGTSIVDLATGRRYMTQRTFPLQWSRRTDALLVETVNEGSTSRSPLRILDARGRQVAQFWLKAATWTPDGRYLAASTRCGPNRGLVRLPVAGHGPRRVFSDHCSILGTELANRLVGNPGRDSIYGGDGDDVLDALDGDDLLDGGAGRDQISGGSGDDAILARDEEPDELSCGNGDDHVEADAVDVVDVSCEHIDRR